MFGLSAGEILVIAIIALVLFGNEKLPENLKKLAAGAVKAKAFLSDITFTWYEIKKNIKNNIEFETEQKKIQELTAPLNIVSQVESEVNSSQKKEALPK